jgi:hypothetical protein
MAYLEAAVVVYLRAGGTRELSHRGRILAA